MFYHLILITEIEPSKRMFTTSLAPTHPTHTQTVADLMERMRREMFSNMTPEREVAPHIDTIILLDRSVDLLTPLSTQLTYEGLIDEIYGIKHSKRCITLTCVVI